MSKTDNSISPSHSLKTSHVWFLYRFSQYIDAHSVPFQCYHYCLQWVTLRLDTFTITVNFIVALFVVISSVYPQSFGVTEGSAFGSLALTYAVQVSFKQRISYFLPACFNLTVAANESVKKCLEVNERKFHYSSFILKCYEWYSSAHDILFCTMRDEATFVVNSVMVASQW